MGLCWLKVTNVNLCVDLGFEMVQMKPFVRNSSPRNCTKRKEIALSHL
jgi:hypothetical protein